MSLRRLDLDFGSRGARVSWAALVLLGAGLAFSADLAVSYLRVREEIAAAEQALARLPARGPAMRVAATPADLGAARDTARRLQLPWQRLFQALESAPAGRVTLVAIEPDADAGRVLIAGEGPDYPAVLDYLRELGRAKGLANVHLVRHELRDDNARRSVAFAVAASWTEAK